MAGQEPGKYNYNWNLLNAVGFLLFGILSIVLGLSVFGASVMLYRWVFLGFGVLLILFAVRFAVAAHAEKSDAK